MNEWLSTGLGLLSDAVQKTVEYSNTITALSTIVLAVLTWVLARATLAMARATSKANIVASLEVNQWTWLHVDLIVQNTGNAPAYDVTVHFDPPLPYALEIKPNEMPFGQISIIRPGQYLSSNVSEFAEVSKNSYRVTLKWREAPKSSKIESNSYCIDIAAIGAISQLGAASPQIQIAEQIKAIREDWKGVANGTKRIQVDGHTQADRDAANAEMLAKVKAAREQREVHNAQNKGNGAD